MKRDSSKIPFDESVSEDIDNNSFKTKARNFKIVSKTGLFHDYFDRLYSLVFYSTGKDQVAAEEITKDTFFTALKSIRTFTGKINLYAWLVGIANNKIIIYSRRLKKERNLIGKTPQNYSGDSVPDFDFERTLFSLPVHYRQVLLLKYLEELPVREIGWIMGRSPKSIEGLLTRARSTLKNR